MASIKEAQPHLINVDKEKHRPVKILLSYNAETGASNFIPWRKNIKEESYRAFPDGDMYQTITELKEPNQDAIGYIEEKIKIIEQAIVEAEEMSWQPSLKAKFLMTLPGEKQNLKEAKDKYKASKVRMWAWIWESLSLSSTRHIEDTRKDEYEEARE